MPPPASRHRAVLTLEKPIPLFDMHSNSLDDLQDVLHSCKKRYSILFDVVSTSRATVMNRNSSLLMLRLIFFSVKQNKELHFEVVIPKDWTPKMYLGALSRSITINKVVALETVELEGHSFSTINELHWMFDTASTEVTKKKLFVSGAYVNVCGGVMM